MNELQIKRDLVVKSLRNKELFDIFEEITDKDCTIFRSVQDLHQSRCVIMLTVDESIYSTVTIFFATLDNLSRKERILDLINELNVAYKANTFFINNNNEIAVQVPYIALSDDFNADIFTEFIGILYRGLKDRDYAKFMRIMW